MQANSTSSKRKPFEDGVPLRFEATFDDGQFALLREGLVPKQMEDKWFIYYEEPYLFLHRSWTGEPVYRLTFSRGPDSAELTEALWSKHLADASTPTQNTDYQVRLLDFLLSNLLLGQPKPFPLPTDIKEPRKGVFQHIVAGTGYPQSSTTSKKRWWRIW
jgi:hypothetical protein